MKNRTGRRWALPIAASLVVSFAASAAAEPYAGVVQQGSASVRLSGAKGVTYQIDLLARRSPAPEEAATLTAAVQKCKGDDCGAAKTYLMELPSDALTFEKDSTAATLDTEFGGMPLKVEWAGSSPSIVAGIEAPEALSVGVGSESGASVTIFGVECSGTGWTEQGVELDQDRAAPSGNPAPAKPPKALRATKKFRPSCAS